MAKVKSAKPKKSKVTKATKIKRSPAKKSTPVKKTKTVKSSLRSPKKAKKSSGINIIDKLQSDFNKSVESTTQQISNEVKRLIKASDKLKKQAEKLASKQKTTYEKKAAAIKKLAAKRTQGATNQLARARDAHKAVVNEINALKQVLARSKAALKAAKAADKNFTNLIKLMANSEKIAAPKKAKSKKIKSSREKSTVSQSVKVAKKSEQKLDEVKDVAEQPPTSDLQDTAQNNVAAVTTTVTESVPLAEEELLVINLDNDNQSDESDTDQATDNQENSSASAA